MSVQWNESVALLLTVLPSNLLTFFLTVRTRKSEPTSKSLRLRQICAYSFARLEANVRFERVSLKKVWVTFRIFWQLTLHSTLKQSKFEQIWKILSMVSSGLKKIVKKLYRWGNKLKQFISFSKQQKKSLHTQKRATHTHIQLVFLFLERNDKDIHYYT